MKEKIDQMNKAIQYGDEQVVMNMATRQIVGHIVDYGDEWLVMKGTKVIGHVVNHGDEWLVMKGKEELGHVVTVEKRKSIWTRVISKCGRIFTA